MNPWRVFPEKEKCPTNGSMGVSSLTDRPLLRVLYRFGPRASSRPVPVTQADAVIRRGAGDDRVEVGVLPGPFQESLHAACLAGSVARRQDCPGGNLVRAELVEAVLPAVLVGIEEHKIERPSEGFRLRVLVARMSVTLP